MRARIVVGLTAAVLMAAAVSSLAGPAGASSRARQDFTVNGEVDGLYPGASATLNARVTNPQSFAIRVTTATATVQDAGPECPGSLLVISGLQTAAEVPAGATVTVPFDVHMDAAAPDACQGVTFRLDFVASAVEADAGSANAPSAEPIRAPPTSFAFTGASIAGLLAIGVILVAFGLVVRRAAARRRGGSAA